MCFIGCVFQILQNQNKRQFQVQLDSQFVEK